MHNEEGSFRRLAQELEQIAKEYGKEFDEVNNIFMEVNGSKQQLRKVLEGQSYTRWDELSDMCLQSRVPSQIDYLIKTRGKEEVEKRCKFL